MFVLGHYLFLLAIGGYRLYIFAPNGGYCSFIQIYECYNGADKVQSNTKEAMGN